VEFGCLPVHVSHASFFEDGLAKVILLLREDLKKNGVLHAIFNAMSAVARISGHLRTSQDISGDDR